MLLLHSSIVCALMSIIRNISKTYMYIKSDYKDQYLEYIRNCGYSPITVRNIVGDTGTLFTWLSAYNFEISIDVLYFRYEQHLIRNVTPINTMNRKLSSLRKFIDWVRSEHMHISDVPHGRNAPPPLILSSKPHRFVWYTRTVSFLLLATGILIIMIIYALRLQSIHNSSTAVIPPTQYAANEKYHIQFDLKLHSPFKPSNMSRTVFMFKFYTNIQQITSIGYVRCPYQDLMLIEGSSRLKILIDRNCSPLPQEVRDVVERGGAIYADIYVNDSKLTVSKIQVNSSSMAQSDSTTQNETKGLFSKASNIDDFLPNSADSPSVLGSETSISTASTSESVPLSMFQNVPPFEDGDIVSIYNNELIKALLSTRIFGIKSADRIITRGVAYVHILNTPDAPITIGDYISTSTTPGYGQKAVSRYDVIVGVALEPYMPGSSYIKVLLNAN